MQFLLISIEPWMMRDRLKSITVRLRSGSGQSAFEVAG